MRRPVGTEQAWILCGTGPMQNEWHVKQYGRVLQKFTTWAAALAYKEWRNQWENWP
jgi:hypothetical protein